jgi:hypothetical protein
LLWVKNKRRKNFLNNIKELDLSPLKNFIESNGGNFNCTTIENVIIEKSKNGMEIINDGISKGKLKILKKGTIIRAELVVILFNENSVI